GHRPCRPALRPGRRSALASTRAYLGPVIGHAQAPRRTVSPRCWTVDGPGGNSSILGIDAVGCGRRWWGDDRGDRGSSSWLEREGVSIVSRTVPTMSASSTGVREAPSRRPTLSTSVSFAAAAGIAFLVFAANAAVSPLYRVYQAEFGFSAST